MSVSEHPIGETAQVIDVTCATVNAGVPLVRLYRIPLGTSAAALVRRTAAFQTDYDLTSPTPVATLPPMGVFSQKIADPEHYILQDGDRLELYQPLILTPMEVRRARARVHPVGKRKPRVNGRR